METMYPGITNSPETTLTSDITNVATTIPVAELGIFPAGPNIATIGTGEDAETILYTDKSASTGAGNLTGCTREFDKTDSYGQKLSWLSGSIISRNFTNMDFYAIQKNIESLSYQKTIEISPAGGDYQTVQSALDANPTEFTLFLVYPGVYADDTIKYTANNQSVIGLDNSTTQILGSTNTNIVDFSTYTGCVLNRITARITGATTSAHTVTGSSGNIIINDCTLEMTNASYTGAVQPSVINITAGGTCEVKFGFIKYSNPVAAAVVKAAILLGAGTYVRLRRGDIQVDGAGASTGTTLSYGTGSGRITATRSVITITDNATTAVVGFYIGGSAIDDEVTNCHIHVNGGTSSATGIWNVDTGTIRSFGNCINIVAGSGSAYSFQVGASATIISVYDDITAADGVVNAGTFTDNSTYYNSGDVTSVSGGVTTIAAKAVTLAKMNDMATASLLGRNTAGTGAPEVLSKTTALALLNVENGADVTDATNVNAAGAVMETDYTAYTVLAADTVSTPLPITIAASTILGRKAAGGIVALTATEVMTILGTFTAAALTRSLILNAYNSLSPDTNPASLDQTELPTNAFPMPRGIFTTSGRGTEQLYWITYMDPQWDEGTVIANVEFTIPTYDAAHSVIWEIYAVRVPNAGLMTTALPLLSTITVGAASAPDYSRILSAETTPLTISGTGNTILWKLKRKLDAADNYAFSAWFNAIKVEYVVS